MRIARMMKKPTPFYGILVIFLFASQIRTTTGIGRVVTDWRIQNKDVTPVLGRGYSVATGNLQSSCLLVEEQTVPSYDYDYFFTEIEDNSQLSVEKSFTGKISTSFSFLWAKNHVETSIALQSTASTTKKKHFLMATMRTERYYASVDEIYSSLSDDARVLLENGEFMSFFQACGPNYIRSVRRAAEITAIFEYESTETDADASFNQDLKLDMKGIFSGTSGGLDQTSSEHVKSHGFKSNLVIYIRGYGLGLNMDGSSSLQARSMEDFKDVMDFAFQSMQQRGVGMVHGIEIVSWVDNPQFQVAARLTDTQNDCKAVGSGNPPAPAPGAAPGVTPAPASECKPVSMELKKMNLVSNGEYIMTMNSVLRASLDSLYNMQFCRSMLYSFFDDQKNAELVNHRKFRWIAASTTSTTTTSASLMTVEALKLQMTDKVLEGRQNTIQNYVDYFYTPCIEVLTEDYGGVRGGKSMVKPWFSIDECKNVACTVTGAIIDSAGTCTLAEPDAVDLLAEQYCLPVLVGEV
jgi:hypothetical protein